MKICQDCEYAGYSPELCRMHIRHCQKHGPSKPMPVPVSIGAKALVGAGLGVAAVVFGATAASLVGGAALIHALAFKLGLGAGIAGGGIGLFKGIAHSKSNQEDLE